MGNERGEAWRDIGGNVPSEMSEASEDALYNMGLGKPEWRRGVERRHQLAADVAQHAINQAGAAGAREAKVDYDRAHGVDVDSVEYRLEQLRAKRNRTRNS